MSSDYFTRTSLYLVRLKIFDWIKFFKFREIACEFKDHYTCKNAGMNLKSTTTNGFNFRIINSLMGSWGGRVRLIWLDCNINCEELNRPSSSKGHGVAAR